MDATRSGDVLIGTADHAGQGGTGCLFALAVPFRGSTISGSIWVSTQQKLSLHVDVGAFRAHSSCRFRHGRDALGNDEPAVASSGAALFDSVSSWDFGKDVLCQPSVRIGDELEPVRGVLRISQSCGRLAVLGDRVWSFQAQCAGVRTRRFL